MKEKIEKMTLSVAEASVVMGVSVPTAYRMLRQRDFPAIHIGTRWIIPKDALKEWLDVEAKKKREIV